MKSLDLNVFTGALAICALASFLPTSNCLASQTAAPALRVAAAPATAAAVPKTDDYPRVTELEQRVLGKTYINEPLAQRVTRLEMKAFGKADPAADLCDRVDKLSEFSPSPNKPSYETDAGEDDSTDDTANSGSTSSAPASTAGGTTATTDGSGGKYIPSDYGNYPRVTALEQKILGHTYEKDPLPVRVARLETKQFGKTSPNDDLADRLDRLDKVVDPHGNALATDGPASSDQDSSQSSGRRGIGGGLGRSLLNMVGGGMLGIGGAGPGLANPSGIGYGVGNTYEPPAPKATDIPNPFLADATPTKGMENKTGVMERFVFGSEHGNLPIAERVQRLEKRLVPYEHHKGDEDLSARVDHLWSMLSAANQDKKKATNNNVTPEEAPFTSNLSVNEFLLVQEAGFMPLGMVAGTSIYHIGVQQSNWQTNEEMIVLSSALYHARELAMKRMIKEAEELGADGIIGVRLTVKHLEWNSDLAEFVAIGTAIKDPEVDWTVDGKPFTSDLSGQDFWSLMHSGYRPVGLVMGNCVYHIAHQAASKWFHSRGKNIEMDNFTEAFYEARELAMQRMQTDAENLQASGIVGAEIHEGTYAWDKHMIEFFAVGTAIAPMQEKHFLPCPDLVLSIDR